MLCTQMITDADLTCNVNQTVMISHTLSLCCAVAEHCTGPHCCLKQSKEWEEFFQPALQETLLTLFMKRSGKEGGGRGVRE